MKRLKARLEKLYSDLEVLEAEVDHQILLGKIDEDDKFKELKRHADELILDFKAESAADKLKNFIQ